MLYEYRNQLTSLRYHNLDDAPNLLHANLGNHGSHGSNHQMMRMMMMMSGVDGGACFYYWTTFCWSLSHQMMPCLLDDASWPWHFQSLILILPLIVLLIQISRPWYFLLIPSSILIQILLLLLFLTS